MIQSTLPSEINMNFEYDGLYPTVGDDLLCSYVEEQISPDHTLTYERTWFLNGQALTNQDGDPITDETITTSEIGEYECTISVTDGSNTIEQTQGVLLIPCWVL